MGNKKTASSYEKRLKRHLIGRTQTFFIATAPGLEADALAELIACCPDIHSRHTIAGGVVFEGRLIDLYTASLHLTAASRILMRIKDFTATAFHQLEKAAKAIPWALYYRPDSLPRVRVTTQGSRLYHSDAVSERLQRVIHTQLVSEKDRDPGYRDLFASSPPLDASDLFVRVKNDRVTLSIDSSGVLLYKRGIKKHGGAAPIRETIASMMLSRSGYRPGMPLIDPMCGSGTFSIEAAFRVCNIPAGRFRRFAFESWPAFRPAQWGYLLKQADAAMTRPGRPDIFTSDRDARVTARLQDSLSGTPLSSALEITCRDFFTITADQLPATPGFVVLNPPYGMRIGDTTDTAAFYNRIFQHLSDVFTGWRVALLLPPDLQRARPAFPVQKHILTHGGLQVTCLIGTVNLS